MRPSRRRSAASLIPVSGIVGFVVIASVVSRNIFVFYAALFVALVCIAGNLMLRFKATD